MLVVFPSIFVADTKLIYDGNFVAPLKLFKATLTDWDIFVNISASVILDFSQRFPTNFDMDNMTLSKTLVVQPNSRVVFTISEN